MLSVTRDQTERGLQRISGLGGQKVGGAGAGKGFDYGDQVSMELRNESWDWGGGCTTSTVQYL